LGYPAGEEHRSGGGQSCGERCRREQQKTGEDEPAGSEQVGGAAAEQQQSAEREGVAADHPGEGFPLQVEVCAHVWQGDRDDGDVEDEHELRDADQPQDSPASRMGAAGRGGCGHRFGHEIASGAKSYKACSIYVRVL
jgi:hypothetical protein